MKIIEAIEKSVKLLIAKYSTYQEMRESQLFNIVKTGMFRRMSLPEKITSLARLVKIFEADFKCAPRRLCKKLVKLNRELNQSIIESMECSTQGIPDNSKSRNA